MDAIVPDFYDIEKRKKARKEEALASPQELSICEC
jgi:hypothetical protein